jgi:predicted nucleic acid-binding protein
MSRYVVDAGVAAKWFIPEPDSDKARRLLESYNQGADDLIAPDLIIAEAANVFWKRAGRGDITTHNAEDNLSDLLALNISLTGSSSLVRKALALAQTHRRSVYDCLYLALSLDQGCDLISSDERLYNAIGSAFPQLKLLRDCRF